MNILLINGSPKGKKSNTYKLSQAFIEGFSEHIPTEIEEITVREKDIKPCIGCFSCWNKTPGKCVIKDEMKDMLEKYLWADVVIWSFGLYYFNVPSKLKQLIDRQLPLALPFMVSDSETGSHPTRYDMSGKRQVIISTCGFYTAKGNYGSVNTMFDHFLGKGNYETIYCGQGELFRVGELHNRTDEYLGFVKNAGEEFANGGISEQTREQLDTLLFPREVFETMADASWGIEKETGKKEDPAYVFTKQMAALYNKNSYQGKDIVLEMDYTDIEKTYQIILKKDGYEVRKDNFSDYTTKIETPLSVWKDIASGTITGTQAMADKLYRVQGDFELMLNWNKYFGSSNAGTAKNNKQNNSIKDKGTSLLLTLIPWIAYWVGVAIDSYIGAFITIGVCALTSVVFFRYRKTVYDVISSAAVIGFSVAALLLPDMVNILLPASYFSFGAMWSVSCLAKIPLTAWYSMKNYNGETALENPLFLRTNRILSLAWGILYICTSVWTFFLMGSPVSSYLAIINNIIPIFMGIFTKWFQNWYPAHFASK
ncbi:MAG: NAD(P)H-dependent oxidoreductase [Ruminococcus sp.]|nr:NAD(P)H-dependent oxidoreductase [Ruminococcus sp.]